MEGMGGGDGEGDSDDWLFCGVWLVTFWRSGFRSDCYLLRHSSETSEGVATSVKNVRPLLS